LRLALAPLFCLRVPGRHNANLSDSNIQSVLLTSQPQLNVQARATAERPRPLESLAVTSRSVVHFQAPGWKGFDSAGLSGGRSVENRSLAESRVGFRRQRKHRANVRELGHRHCERSPPCSRVHPSSLASAAKASQAAGPRPLASRSSTTPAADEAPGRASISVPSGDQVRMAL
jgi:hypothetical protein